MKLQDHLSAERPGEPEQGSQGTQSEWLDFCELELNGPRFLVVDASFVPSAEDGLLIETPAGKAAQWYRKAALKGLPVALTKLAILLRNGQGIKQDWNGAVDLFREAAGKRYAEAQYNLGLLYVNGEGVTQDLLASKPLNPQR